MTLKELGEKLNKMYTNAPERESVAMIHLFGIHFSKEIVFCGVSKIMIVKEAKIPKSYSAEINKRVKLAKHVTLNKETIEMIENIMSIWPITKRQSNIYKAPQRGAL